MYGSVPQVSTECHQHHRAPHTPMGWTGVALGLLVIGVFLVMFVVTFTGAELPGWALASALGLMLALVVTAVATGVIARRTDRSTLGLIALVVACATGLWLLLGLADMLFS